MSDDGRDDEVLLRLAQDVADGRPVDWDGEASATTTSLDRLKRLQILASIAATCGMPRETLKPATAPTEPRAALFRWGHLEIREKVGAGAFGEVYRAWETTLDREVAVKFLRAPPGETGSAIEHVLHEGRNLARVRHPNVVAVYGAERLDDRVGTWMEFIRGITLEENLMSQGPLSAQEAAMVGIELCRALAAVHAAGLVHNDIKTRNVMREEGGRVVLMDFGTGADPQLRALSGTRTLTGTPYYLAPELLVGEPMSAQSDLYSMGVLLYRLVTRRYPFEAKSLEELQYLKGSGEMKLLRDLRPDLPEPFIRVVEQALAVDPARRFATAGQMEQALARTLGSGTTHPAAETRVADRWGVPPAAQGSSRRRSLWIAAGVATLVVMAAFVAPRLRPSASAPGKRVTLAVADFVNETGEADLDGLASMLATSLEQSRSLSVVTRSRMHDILARLGKEPTDRIDEALGVQIGRHAGLGALVLPTIRRFGDRYRIDVQVLDPMRNEYLFTAQESAKDRRRIPAMIDRLSERTRAALRVQGPPRAADQSVERIVTPNLEAFRWYEEGERHIDRVEMTAARASLERAVALDSAFGLAYSRLAYVHWWLGDGDGERRLVQRAWSLVDRIPDRERYHLRAQRAVAENQGLEAGRAILLEMERFYPDDKQMLYSIGDLSFHLSEYPLAVRYLERVLDQDPGFVPALQHLTRTFREMGRREPMLATARRYAAADTSWESGLLLGEALAATGASRQGIEVMSRGRDQYPDRLIEFTNPLALACAFSGDAVRAEAEWTRLLLNPTPATQRWGTRFLSRWVASRGSYRRAVALVDRSIESARADRDSIGEALARLDRASLRLAGWNDPGPARTELGRRLEYDGMITYQGRFYDYWPYWGGLFKLALQCGMTSEAEALAKQKFALDKWYGPYVEAHLACAKGEWRQAEAAARQVLDWGPAAESLELLYRLADSEYAHGELQGAAESLRRLIALRSSLTPDTPYTSKALLLLGRVQEDQGRPDLALATYESLAERWGAADEDLEDRRDLTRRLARLRAQRRAS